VPADLLLVSLSVARAFGWIAAPAWVLLVFDLVLPVFGLTGWAFAREQRLSLPQDDERLC
jgi:hypothetical protein